MPTLNFVDSHSSCKGHSFRRYHHEFVKLLPEGARGQFITIYS